METRWENFRRRYWGKEPLPEPESKEPKLIDGWQLTITENGKVSWTYSTPEMKPLWKIYKWYLTKDSEKYNIEFKDGMRILNRFDVTSMELKKAKINDIWTKENNDET